MIDLTSQPLPPSNSVYTPVLVADKKKEVTQLVNSTPTNNYEREITQLFSTKYFEYFF